MSGIELDFGDAVGQRLYLLLGLAERGFASLDRFGEDVGPLNQ